jgi:DNA-binding beta-propeller fold protein YncE
LFLESLYITFDDQGNGIVGAKILIDGKQQTTSVAGGKYHLENMKTGTYRIQVQIDNVFFDEVNVKITPNTPQIQDIIASGFVQMNLWYQKY